MSRGDRIVLVEEPSKTLCVGGEKGAPHDGFGESGSGIAGAFSVGSGIAFDGEEDRGPPRSVRKSPETFWMRFPIR